MQKFHPARLRAAAADFATDQSGGATIWNLTWLLGFAAIAGLAVDSTNGWRNKTMLQSTADVAALAGAIDIPNPSRKVAYTADGYEEVEDAALLYADKNQSMAADEFGNYLKRDDIEIGHWDVETRVWTDGPSSQVDSTPVNAVRVYNVLNVERGNGIATALLHMVGLPAWDIRTAATAMKGHDSCYLQGLMTRDEVCVTSNNHIYPGVCIHGEDGLNFRSGNEWATEDGAPAVEVSSNGTDNVDDSNFENGLKDPVDRGTRYVPMVDYIPEITNEILAGNSHMAQPQFASWPVVELMTTKVDGTSAGTTGWLESGIRVASLDGFGSVASLLAGSANFSSPGCGGGSSNGSLVEPVGDRFNTPVDLTKFTSSVLEENQMYYAGNRNVTLSGAISNVVVVTHGRISVDNTAVLEDVTLVSLKDDANGPDTVTINGAQIGRPDDCAPGGGVKIYSMGSVNSSSGARWDGVMIVSGGSVGVAAQSDGIHGLAVFAAGNLKFTANSSFGSADGSGLGPDGSCGAGTPVSLWDDAYRVRLVQ